MGQPGFHARPSGWPKFTGQWIIPSAAVGDIDGDNLLEVVDATRAGWLYAWNTPGDAEGAISWESFHHDNRNTGDYDTPLGHGAHTVAPTPLDCSALTPPDFPRPLPDECYADGGEDGTDGGEAGDGGDGGPAFVGGGGCSCRTAPANGLSPWLLLLVLGAFLRLRRR
jgi:MYXO-CTERM domain-containing protein